MRACGLKSWTGFLRADAICWDRAESPSDPPGTLGALAFGGVAKTSGTRQLLARMRVFTDQCPGFGTVAPQARSSSRKAEAQFRAETSWAQFRNCAPVRSAAERSAPSKTVLKRLAPERLAPARLASRNWVPRKSARERSARARS